jgi:DNA replication protein DnaC
MEKANLTQTLKNLKEFGTRTPNFLAPQSEKKQGCPRCNGAPWVLDENEQAVRCSCWVDRVKSSKLKAIPDKFLNSTFKSYRGLPKEITAASNSYFICGQFGKGKTHLLCAQYRKIIEAGYFHTKFVREVDLIADLQKQAYEKEHKPLLSLGELERKKEFHLFIDDFGKTPLSDDRSYQIFKLIDLVYINRFKLSITSNFSLRELEGRFDSDIAGGIVRRIQGICIPTYV